jgi:L-alanine-DL-glutamate epimerase-like enolase superfamily enzyme
VALWDVVAKIADRVFCYVGGGWYFPGQTIQNLQDEMRRHLDAGYTMVKIKAGGLPS